MSEYFEFLMFAEGLCFGPVFSEALGVCVRGLEICIFSEKPFDVSRADIVCLFRDLDDLCRSFTVEWELMRS